MRLEGTNIRFFTWDAAGQVRSRTATGAGTKNVWHHVHAEISNVAARMSLTVDGISQPPATGNNMKTASAPIEVGFKSVAASGDPNSPGAPDWPLFDAAAEQIQSMKPPAPVSESGFATDHMCSFWLP